MCYTYNCAVQRSMRWRNKGICQDPERFQQIISLDTPREGYGWGKVGCHGGEWGGGTTLYLYRYI